MLQIEQVEARLREAMALKKAAGIRVEPGSWGVLVVYPDPGQDGYFAIREGCLCPMGCMVAGKPVPYIDAGGCGDDPEAAAAKELGITPQQVLNFVCGFDNISPGMGLIDFEMDEFWALGSQLRLEYRQERGFEFCVGN